MKSYWERWSLIFGRNLKWKFGCTSTSKISMSYHSNQTCRVCFKILGTCRFWNCHCFLDLIMISWRNHCLENVNLLCWRGKTPSFVPLGLHFTVYASKIYMIFHYHHHSWIEIFYLFVMVSNCRAALMLPQFIQQCNAWITKVVFHHLK